MNNIAIIPARGGSKRLKKKNILPVQDKPMLAYPVANAIKSEVFDQVIVSTEDKEIGAIGQEAGARFLKRPEKLAQDRSTVVEVCKHVLEELGKENALPDFFCCIYATAIFLTPKDIVDSLELLTQSSNVNVVMGVSKYNLQPVQAMEKKEDGLLSPMWPDFVNIQSQFHPYLVVSNGTLYWARTERFLEKETFYDDTLMGYEMPWVRALDIDTKESLEIVKMIAPTLLA
ncbi:MAG: acylneuraminate cytidylyltransferase family protein [Desulfobacteraceae bacterium]|nr:acylneuraminate cytidylyltransferase family protein [Desulfobacteraceae bacterium]